MIIIGITGGVGAGKSTVLDYLEKKYGAQVIQADKAGHLVMEPDGICYDAVTALFGKEVIKNDKTIDRRRISDVVFSHPEMLEKLNAIIHPAVRTYICGQLEEAARRGEPLLVVEAALLLEENYQEFCDEVWYIHADKEIRISRLMENRGYTRQKSEDIIARQASEEFFRTHTDYEVDNGGSLEETYRQIDKGLEKFGSKLFGIDASGASGKR